MCRYCKNWNTPCSKLQLGDVIIVGCAKYTHVGDGAEHGMPMRYCPNCGEEMAVMTFADTENRGLAMRIECEICGSYAAG